MMVQSGMPVGHVCSAYGRAIQPQHWTRNHHLHSSTLNHPLPHLPLILYADANHSLRNPHPCKDVPPASKHPWLSIPRENALQALEENQAQAKGQDEDEQPFHGQFTYGLSFGSSSKLVVVLSVPSGSGSSGSIKRAVLPGTRLLAWPSNSKLKTQGLKSNSTQIPSPLMSTTTPHYAWQTRSTCLRISILTKQNNKLGESMMDWLLQDKGR
jgi:hypothetical protein